MRKNKLFRHEGTILRVLEEKEDSVLSIDCGKRSMPRWISLEELRKDVEIAVEDFLAEMG